jgi:hypothetical protein
VCVGYIRWRFVQSLSLHMWDPRIPFLILLSVSNTLRVIKTYVPTCMTLFVVNLDIDQHVRVNLETRKIMLSLHFLFSAFSISNSQGTKLFIGYLYYNVKLNFPISFNFQGTITRVSIQNNTKL